jgi:ECF sigma factor
MGATKLTSVDAPPQRKRHCGDAMQFQGRPVFRGGAGSGGGMMAHGAYAGPASPGTHFLAVASTTMRRVLVDHARARAALKRGGGGTRVTVGARIVEMRFSRG